MHTSKQHLRFVQCVYMVYSWATASLLPKLEDHTTIPAYWYRYMINITLFAHNFKWYV